MNLPTLSVIIPNYNHGHCLPTCVRALVNQSVQPLEIIIIDDGSTDDSIQVIKELAREYPIIRFHENGRNQGVSPTLNRGIDLAQGEYLFFPGADDETQPGFLEKSMALLARHPQAGLSCTIGDWREIATGLNWYMGAGMGKSPRYLSPADMIELERKNRFYITMHSVILKRSALIEAGKFIPELKFASDWFSHYVVGFRYGMCFVPEVLAVFNIHPNSYYQRNRRDERGYREVLEQMLKLLNEPRYRDAAQMIREAGSLFTFALPMLKLMLSRPEYRWLITPQFLRKCLAHSVKLSLKKLGPTWLVRFYLRFSGYRAQQTTGA